MTAAQPDSLAAPLTTGLLSAAHWISRRLEDAVRRPHGPGLDAWRVLDLLAGGVGHPMSEIAAHAMIPASTLTKVVNPLVQCELVHLQRDDTDRRRVLVVLADRGRAQHTAVALAVAAVERELCEALGPETETVLRALGRLT